MLILFQFSARPEKFLTKKNKGYEFEVDNGEGLFVTPVVFKDIDEWSSIISYETIVDSRTVKYAHRTPIIHFDKPVVLSVTIKAKYLIIASQKNRGYEAGLPVTSVDHLNNMRLLKAEKQV